MSEGFTAPSSDDPEGTDVSQASLELLSDKSLLFRAKLIQDFKLTHTTGSIVRKRIFARDVKNDDQINYLMRNDPDYPIDFDSTQLNKTRKLVQQGLSKVDKHQRREHRLKFKHSLFTPASLWAHWISESKVVSVLGLVSILINVIVVGIQLDYGLALAKNHRAIHISIAIVDCVAGTFLILQLLMKWIDDFERFWSSRWNILDFFITLVAVLPHILLSVSPRLVQTLSRVAPQVVTILTVLRALLCIKLVNRLPKVQMLILAISQASRPLAMVFLLFIIAAYVVSLFGVMMFESYAVSNKEELKMNEMFLSVDQMLILLFRLYTLDGWHALYKEMAQIVGRNAAFVYLVGWIVVGCYIIGNMFIGILVSNFIQIRQDLLLQVERQREDKLRQQAEDITKIKFDMSARGQMRRGSVTGEAGEDKNEEVLSAQSPQSVASAYLGYLPAGDPIDDYYDDRKKKVKVLVDSCNTPTSTPPIPPKAGISSQIKTNIKQFSSIGLNVIEQKLLNSKPVSSEVPSHTQLRRTNGGRIAPPSSAHRMSLFNAQCQGVSLEADNINLWQRVIGHLGERLKRIDNVTMWSTDTYLQYLMLLEHLMENLAEREDLLKISSQALLDIMSDLQVTKRMEQPVDSEQQTKESQAASSEERRKSMRESLLAVKFLDHWKYTTDSNRRNSILFAKLSRISASFPR